MKDKIKKAAAIKYDPNETAPQIIAKGKGIVADNILEKAKTEDIPIYEDKELADQLTKLELGELIPPELYKIVAEILMFVSDLDELGSKINERKQ